MTYDEYLERAHIDYMGCTKGYIIEKVAELTRQVDMLGMFLDEQHARNKDLLKAMQVPSVMKYATYSEYDTPNIDRTTDLTWSPPQLRLIRGPWAHLENKDNVAALIEDTAKVWGRTIAHSLFKVAYGNSTD
jgi:hypothetical protein